MTKETPENTHSSAEELSALLRDVEKHNKQFSLGSMMAKVIFDSVRESIDDRVDNEKGMLEKQREDRHVAVGSFVDAHANILNAMGLRAEPVSGKTATVFAGGDQLGTGEMRLNIGNQETFLHFLQTLSAEDVREHRTLPSDLGKLVGVLEQQMKDHYSYEKPSDEALNLLASMGSIVQEFDRLGLQEQVNTLRSYLEKARAGYLREDLLVQRAHIMPREGWGPSMWHADCTAESLKRLWDKAIRVLEEVQKNPRANALAEKLHSHLLDSVGKSMQDLSQKPDSYYARSVSSKAELQEVLEEARSELMK